MIVWKTTSTLTYPLKVPIRKSSHGTGLKLFTPKQMLHRLSITFPQEKAGNISENLLD